MVIGGTTEEGDDAVDLVADLAADAIDEQIAGGAQIRCTDDEMTESARRTRPIEDGRCPFVDAARCTRRVRRNERRPGGERGFGSVGLSKLQMRMPLNRSGLPVLFFVSSSVNEHAIRLPFGSQAKLTSWPRSSITDFTPPGGMAITT